MFGRKDWSWFGDLGFDKRSLDMTPKVQTTKQETINWTSSKFKILCLKRHYHESKMTSHRMGENNCKSYFL